MKEQDPHWYKDAILYELHVRAFYDSNKDGIGDFRGLTEKLEYLHDLGVTGIWLLPFYPSPLKDAGYDIADYTGVHSHYGTLADFQTFVQAAHQRGLRVVTELVLNHTSDQHPWFQRARRAPAGSVERDFYVWSDTPERYQQARVIFQDFELSNWAWDPVARAYYWHRFYAHQPDLNYDNPAVREAVLPVIDFWLHLGVDGLRLDAVPYLYEREGTHSENLSQTHQFLRTLRRHVEAQFLHCMLLAEANQWPEDACAYFGQGDECHMAFHFPLMPRLFMAIHTEDRLPIVDIMAQTPSIPEHGQWALFLRNHDELTLEMVTDEERCYLCWVYAQDPQARINLGIRRRLAPLLGNNRRRIELMHGLLFSLPGTPVLYYGDEIGMGDNIYLGDRNGVRTPMQWSPDLNAGFSRANPQQLYLPPIIDPEYHYQAVNVAAQQENRESLWWWMQRLIAVRKRHQAFGRGSLEFLNAENQRILAFIRRYRDETLCVVANLSRFVQHVTLDLSAYHGLVPVELFGRTAFPVLNRKPFFLTLAPYAFYWFALEPQRRSTTCTVATTPEAQCPVLTVSGPWERIFHSPSKASLETVLAAYLPRCCWFSGRYRPIGTVRVQEAVPLLQTASTIYLVLLYVEYLRGDPDLYALPVACAVGAQAERLLQQVPPEAMAEAQVQRSRPTGALSLKQVPPEAMAEAQVQRSRPTGALSLKHVAPEIIARVQGEDSAGVLYDALYDPAFCTALLQGLISGEDFDAGEGIRGWTVAAYPHLQDIEASALEPALLQTEQSNTLVVYEDRLILKLFRRLEDGVNPELEVGHFPTQHHHAVNTSSVVGALEYYRRGPQNAPITLGVLQGYVPHHENAWEYTLSSLESYFDRALTAPASEAEATLSTAALLDLAKRPVPPLARQLLGPYQEFVRLLGRRTAELHQVLASESEDPAFAPEPFSFLYQRSLYQSMRSLTVRVHWQLQEALPRLPAPVRAEARELLARQDEVLQRFQAVLSRPLTCLRIRCHGDYHLRQVLRTEKDVVLIDFEGEPARLMGERRLKRCPLFDVAGMLRSFHYAACVACFDRTARQGTTPAGGPAPLEIWTRCWYGWVSAIFVRAYPKHIAGMACLPQTREKLRILCDVHLLEKAIYQIGDELEHRPDWVKIPLHGLLQLLGPARA